MIKKIEGYDIVAPPKRPSNRYKKYEVYKDDKYITAFGDNRYGQFKDKIGYWSEKNTYDKQQRARYRMRHAKDKGVINEDPNYSGWWSWHYLWS